MKKNRQAKAEGYLRAATAQMILLGQGGIEGLLDTSSDMICAYEMDSGFFVKVNQSWKEVLGWTEEELTIKPFMEFVHPNDRKRTADVYEALAHEDMSSVNSFIFTNKWLHKDGHYIELQWNVRKAVSFQNYGMSIARPISSTAIDNFVRPSMISTIFEDNPDATDEPLIVGPKYTQLFSGMICRDLAPFSIYSHKWQCITEAETEDPMGWHRHPDQDEDLSINSGKLIMEIQVYTIWQKLGLQDKLKKKKTKVVVLREGDVIKSPINLWHRLLESDEAANFEIDWKPKKYSD